jgi:S-layer homology domain.
MKHRILRSKKYLALATVAIFLLVIAVASASPTTFPDVVGHWAQSAIEKVADLGLIHGHADGNFGPDENVTRAQLATILANDVDQRAAATNTLIDSKFNTTDRSLSLWNIQPGLGTIMIEYANRFDRLYFAANAGNWDMATYQLAEMWEIQEVGEVTRPGRAPMLKAFEDAYGPAVKSAIDAKDGVAFTTAFNSMIAGCNGCHAASSSGEWNSYKFVHIQAPTADPADYIDWAAPGLGTGNAK